MKRALVAAFLLAACASSVRDCAVCPDMVAVPAGAFTMGSPQDEAGRDPDEGPQIAVRIARPFALGRFEVTRGEYAAFVAATGYAADGGCYTDRDGDGAAALDSQGFWRDPGFAQRDSEPVVCVNWRDAQAYIAWLNTHGVGGYRLPSEAEWEYAARAGGAGPFGGATPCAIANANDAACRESEKYTAPVGSFRANAFGLHDMHGNVWEWTQDCYAPSLATTPRDGAAYEVEPCARRADRGGAWSHSEKDLRAANRFGIDPALRVHDLGFRVARTMP